MTKPVKKSVTVNGILRENRCATREEMNDLYLQIVCGTTCMDVIELMSEQELKRLLSIRLLEFWILGNGHRQSYAIQVVSTLLNITKRALYKYIKNHGIYPKNQVNG